MERSKVAIIIPAYNEEKTIKNVIEKVKLYGCPIIIDDCSTDKTKKIAKLNNVIVISNKKNIGYEKSLKKGFEFALRKKFDFFITIDGDNQHDASQIKKIVESLKNYDVVFTIRNNFNRFSETLLSIIANFCYDIKDPLSGLKGYRKNILKFYKFEKWNQSFGSDILFFSKKNNFKIKGIKTKVKNRKDISRVGNSITVNIKILILIMSVFKTFATDKIEIK